MGKPATDEELEAKSQSENQTIGRGVNLNSAQSGDVPWMDFRLSEEVMNYLWGAINHLPEQQLDARKRLAGNISKSDYIEDKDDWFYENVLKAFCETMYLENWNNYYNVCVAKIAPHPIFELYEMWTNYQKQHEFNPPHTHEGFFSFVVFMKIPTYWEEQYKRPAPSNSNTPCASDFQFLLGNGRGITTIAIPLCPEDEGRILFFPSWLSHQVFPFYGTEEERITISGNVVRKGLDNLTYHNNPK